MLLLIAFAPTYIIVINLTSVQDVLECPGLGLRLVGGRGMVRVGHITIFAGNPRKITCINHLQNA